MSEGERHYRTELLGPGINDDRWSLYIDGKEIAATDPGLTNDEARAWSNRELGERMQWLPALDDECAAEALAAGSWIDWVASPDRPEAEVEAG